MTYREEQAKEKKVERRLIDGFPDCSIGDDGSVESCKNFGMDGKIKWKQKKQTRHSSGYMFTNLYNKGKHKLAYIADIVLTAFVGPRPIGMKALHHPCPDKTNNRLDNLRWGTDQENSQDAIKSGTISRGESHGNAKLTEADVKEIRRLYAEGQMSYRDIAKLFCVQNSAIWKIVKKLAWKHVS